MSADPEPPARRSGPTAGKIIVAAGLVAGVLDIGYIIVYYAVKGVAAERVLQGVAAGAFGREAAGRGGWTMALVGLGFHFVIAIGAAAVFYALSRRVRWLVEKPWLGGPVYGVVVWLFMNLAVLPLSATPPKTFFGPTWIVVLIAHLTCVGLPIAWVTRWGERTRVSA